jgi:hypothetical protein
MLLLRKLSENKKSTDNKSDNPMPVGRFRETKNFIYGKNEKV